MSDDVFANKPLDSRRMITVGGAGPIELSIATIGGDLGFSSVSHRLTPAEAFSLARAIESRAYSVIVADCHRAGVEAPELTGGIEGIDARQSIALNRAFFQAIGGVRNWFEKFTPTSEAGITMFGPKNVGRAFGDMMNSIVEGVAKDGDAAKSMIDQIRSFVLQFHAIGVRGGTERLLFVAGMMEAVGDWSKEAKSND